MIGLQNLNPRTVLRNVAYYFVGAEISMSEKGFEEAANYLGSISSSNQPFLDESPGMGYDLVNGGSATTSPKNRTISLFGAPISVLDRLEKMAVIH